MAFREVSGKPTQTETDYWDVALDAEAKIRGYLVENKIRIVARPEFDLSVIADGMLAGDVPISVEIRGAGVAG